MSSAVNIVCKVCRQTTVDGRPYFEQRQVHAPFGWDRIHSDCYDPTGAKGYRKRIAELEGRLRIWLHDYERSADGALVTIPVHQLVELLGEPDLFDPTAAG